MHKKSIAKGAKHFINCYKCSHYTLIACLPEALYVKSGLESRFPNHFTDYSYLPEISMH